MVRAGLSLEVEARRLDDDHPMPLHGPKLEAPDSGNKMVIMRTKLRGVSSRVVACQHDDQLVGPGAIRCQPSHRVLGALELVAVADEDQAIRRLVWGRPWEGRKGRSEGNECESDLVRVRARARVRVRVRVRVGVRVRAC